MNLAHITLNGKTVDIPYTKRHLPGHVLITHKLSGIQGLGEDLKEALADFEYTFNYCFGRLNQFEDHQLSRPMLLQKIVVNDLFK